MVTRAAGVGLVCLLALVCGGCTGDGDDEALAPWQIVFQSDRGGEFAWWAIRPNGSALKRIGEMPGMVAGLEPTASPDGRRLLLSTLDDLIVVDDRGRRRLAKRVSSVAWSPEGERVAFGVFEGSLWVIDADGRHRQRLTRGPDDAVPAWSPDGERLAFVRSGVGVGIVNADGSEERILWRSLGDISSLEWTDDGDALSFLHFPYEADILDPSQLITLEVDTRRILSRRKVPNEDAYAQDARVPSPDGRLVATERALDNYQRLEIHVANEDGSERRRVTAPGENGSDPIWSADGDYLVYRRHGVGGTQLWRVRADGTGRRAITRGYPDGGDIALAEWSRIDFRHEPSPYRPRARRTATGGELSLPFPVWRIGAAGGTAVFASPVRVYGSASLVTPPLVMWTPGAAAVSRVAITRCDVPDSIVLSGGLVAHDCRLIPHAVAVYGGSVYVFARDRRSAVSLSPGRVSEENRRPGSVPGRVAGGGGEIIYAIDAFDGRGNFLRSSLWRVRGNASLRIAGDVGEPVAVDRGRIATEHPDGRVFLVALDGRVLRMLSPGDRAEMPSTYRPRQAPTVGLFARDLVVLRGGRLSWYDAPTGRLRSTRSVGTRAAFAGVARGLAAYTSGRNVHVLRLRDGKRTTFRPHGRDVRAMLATSGLFYASQARPVPHQSIQRHIRNPATVVFVHWDTVERRLR